MAVCALFIDAMFVAPNRYTSVWPMFSSVSYADCFNLTNGIIEGKTLKTVKSRLEQLCNEVIRENPGMQDERQDLVAQRMNAFLYAEKHWRSPSCIFDGRTCHSLFRQLVVRPANERFLAAQHESTAVDAVPGDLLGKKLLNQTGFLKSVRRRLK
ncbi:LAQU0S05e03928g1_1 [Lachancea quebecensis]|uniref:LAQU0S05e03928g1_1 n=1 Tax=Lachancea quebecensis TaxID=1654605 RepID=A0A0P1KRI8_9SACH|nr:LAQU0S05e03928g1_1 [Lachancea quebecensis]